MSSNISFSMSRKSVNLMSILIPVGKPLSHMMCRTLSTTWDVSPGFSCSSGDFGVGTKYMLRFFLLYLFVMSIIIGNIRQKRDCYN